VLWAVGFLADLAWVPTTIDGPASGPTWAALAVDLGLLLLFAVQHSVMARAAVKRRVHLPVAVERSTFVLASGVVLGLLFWQWRPLPGTVWSVAAQPWVGLLWTVYGLGWVIAIAATFLIDHWDFVGLRQARWDDRLGPYAGPGFTERWLYAWVRHPLMLGLLITFWATPTMTVGHLVFAVAATGYVAVGLHFEERDLRRALGASYGDYADRVPAVLPRVRFPRRRRPVLVD
jgi:protein-S-isoprenylcysteine O-methyltransferase Ste14